MPSPWSAPAADGPVRAAVTVPGSKSITNRALVLAALAHGPSTVAGALRSRDTELMAAALRALGAEIDLGGPAGPGRVGPGPVRGGVEIDCGLAGTVMRFVPPVAVLADGDVRFDGDPHARLRPMSTVLGALRTLGAGVDGDRLPFTVSGTGALRGGQVTIDASASSQFVSGLLLAGARYDRGVDIHHDGKPVPSRPHLAMTVQMLRAAGVEVDDAQPDRWRVRPGAVDARAWVVEPDLSNAAPFLAAAAITGGRVTVPGWPRPTTQAGDAMRGILTSFGAAVGFDGPADALVVDGPGRLVGVDLDLHEVGELTPTVAALCAVADGPSTLRGIAHLRGHETDRLAALVTELDRAGAAAPPSEHDDGITVRPAALTATARPWHAYADHRMATAGAVLGLVVPGLAVDDIGTTAKTLPDFPALWSAMLDGGPG